MDLTLLKERLPLDELAKKIGMKHARSGARYESFLCSWHDDSSPSFSVDKVRGTARCWVPACPASKPMDHVGLLRLHEHLPEDMAVDRLYQLAGEERPMDTLHDVLRRALRPLMDRVNDPLPAAFFSGRGVSAEALRGLGVGYSPSFPWFKEMVLNALPQEESAKLELYRTVMFDNAIVYPLHDALGRVAGFKSRPMGGTFAKYIGNGGEFPLRPSRLYGVHLVRGSQLILVEGPNDVLALRSAGVISAAGLMGTNLKDLESHLVEHGFADAVFVADGDEAGRGAMFKAPPLMRVTMVPPGPQGETVDPDEFIMAHGIEGISRLVKEAKYPFEIRLDAFLEQPRDTLTRKIMLIKRIALEVAEGLPPILLSKVQGKIAQAMEVPVEDVASIFDLVDVDTTDLERKIVWHVYAKGVLAEEVKLRVTPDLLADPRLRRQYQEVLKGQTVTVPAEKADELHENDLVRFVDLSRRRQLKGALLRSAHSVANLNEPVDELLARIMVKIAGHVGGEFEEIGSLALLEVGVHNALERAKTPGQILGISFGNGFKQLDEVLQGLRPNGFYIIGATQGTGKSAVTLQIASNMAFDQGVSVLWLSLEMSALDMSNRLLASRTGIPAARIMRGSITPEETERIVNASIKGAGAPFHSVICGGLNVHQIVSLVRRYKVTHGIKAVFLDYLQLVDGGSHADSMYERVGNISRTLKSSITMDRTIGLPVVAVAQLSKAAARRDVPTAEDIAESYKIVQDADAVLLLRKFDEDEVRAHAMNGKSYGNLLCVVAKNRSGPDGALIGLNFRKDVMQVREVVPTP